MSNPSLLCVPYRFKTSKLYSQIPDSGLGDFVVTRATTPTAGQATRVNAQGFIELVADNVPRLDYPVGGITAGCPALLVEPAATNGIRNNSMVGAVAGSPGTLPTNWALSSAGLTSTIIATGSENGVQFIDIRFNGTATGTLALIEHESNTQIVASNGQAWTYSVYAKVVSAPAPAGAYRINIREFTSGGGTVAEGTSDYTPTSSLARYSATRTLSGGPTVARVAGRLYFTLAIGSTYDFTIRIGYPQIELGSVATSVIPTTTAAITRGAETISKTGVSSLIGQTQGTIYCEFAYFGQPAIRSGPIYLRQASSAGLSINFAPSDFPAGISFISRNNGGSTALIIVSGALQIGTYYKIAIGYDAGGTAAGGSQANGIVAYVNGVQTAIGTFRVPDAAGLTEFRMYGANAGTDAEAFNGRIRAHSLYPTRLPNTGPLSLQSLTQ